MRLPNPFILQPSYNCQSFPILLADESISQYLNTDGVFTESANYVLALVDEQFNIVADALSGLNQDVITTGQVRFYLTPTIPTGLIDGRYRFLIYDTTVDNVTLITNPYLLLNDTNTANEISLKLSYRNYENIRNYNYEGLTSFYNIIRVPILEPTQPTFEFRNVSKYTDTKTKAIRYPHIDLRNLRTMETYWMDEEMQEATAVLMEHSEVYFVDVRNRRMTMNLDSGFTPVQVERGTRLARYQFEVYEDAFGEVDS